MGGNKNKNKNQKMKPKASKSNAMPKKIIAPKLVTPIEQEAKEEVIESAPVSEPVLFQPANQNVSTVDDQKKTTRMKEKSDWRWLLSGAIGGALVVLAIVFVALLHPGYRVSNYYVNEDPSLLTELLSADLTPTDSTAVALAIQEETAKRNELINDLLEQKIIVSSDVYASNLSGYYNTLIAVLSAILIIINLIGFFSWRSNANVSLEQKRREMDDAIKNIDDSLEKNLEETFRKNLVVKEKMEAMVRDLIEQGEQLDEEEWEKLHLLLKQYKRKETLEAIKADETENNGEIEE